MTAPRTPPELLEADFGTPNVFKRPVLAENHTPGGLYQIKPNHIGDCFCETGEGEFWLQGDAAMKWRGSER